MPDQATSDIGVEVTTSTSVPTIRIYSDPNGGYWKFVPIPVSQTEVTSLQILADQGRVNLEVEALPDENFRAAEMAWLSEHLAELSETIGGQWVAIDGDSLIAHAPSLVEALRIAANVGHADPFVSLIPDHDPSLPFIG